MHSEITPYLANGRPRLVAPAFLVRSAQVAAVALPALVAIRAQHPDASLSFDRISFTAETRRGGGGPRFTFKAPIQVCYACQILGGATLAYDFDSGGRFRGASVVEISARGSR